MKKFLAVASMAALMGLMVPMHAQVLKGSKAKKPATKNAKTMKSTKAASHAKTSTKASTKAKTHSKAKMDSAGATK